MFARYKHCVYSVHLPPPTLDTAGNGDSQYKRMRDLPHRSHNETLRSHTMLSVKLSEIGIYSV